MNKRYIAVVLMILTCGAKFAAAQVRGQCSLSAVNVDFGIYTGSTIRMTGTLIVNCTPNAVWAVGLNEGTAPGATVTNRSMTSGQRPLNYALYSDASYSTNWGNTPGTGWVTGVGTGNPQLLLVYAQLPSNQFAIARNNYFDTVTAVISGSNFNSDFASLRVTASILSNCLLSATDLAFGTYSGSLINATSTILVACTNATPYNVGLNAGTATGATVTTRSMTGPGGTLLGYKLFSNSGRTVNWGNTVGTNTVPGTGTGGVQTLTVYGQLPANQNGPPGSYSDTITVTLTF